MQKLPLMNGVLEYIKKRDISFCMPGHKGGRGFLTTDEGRKFLDNIVRFDITEVEGVDNLHAPCGIIKESQELLSKYYKSKKSYYLVNGSTSGNLIMMFSSFNEGDKVIIERNCHNSIYNGIALRKLNPVYIKNRIDNFYDAPLSIDMEHFFKIINENSDAKGIIINYPNYYGFCSNLPVIIREAKKRGMKVLVDSAHGAHFVASSFLPESSVELGADMTVMSAHKTLSSFNQSAYLHLGNDADIERTDRYADAFLSTSPSYMLLCSMEYARFLLEERGEENYRNLIEMLNYYREKINELGFVHAAGREAVKDDIYDIDLTRYVLHVKGTNGFKMMDYLERNGIDGEMTDGQNVVLIFSPFNTEDELEKLYIVLKNFRKELWLEKDEKKIDIVKTEIPEQKMKCYEAYDAEKESIDFKDSEGRICGEKIIPYPPGVPLVNTGEVIKRDVIDAIKYYREKGAKLIGINDSIIKVCKDK